MAVGFPRASFPAQERIYLYIVRSFWLLCGEQTAGSQGQKWGICSEAEETMQARDHGGSGQHGSSAVGKKCPDPGYILIFCRQSWWLAGRSGKGSERRVKINKVMIQANWRNGVTTNQDDHTTYDSGTFISPMLQASKVRFWVLSNLLKVSQVVSDVAGSWLLCTIVHWARNFTRWNNLSTYFTKSIWQCLCCFQKAGSVMGQSTGTDSSLY